MHNVPMIDPDHIREYWLFSFDDVVVDPVMLSANYPQEWMVAVKLCFQQHNDIEDEFSPVLSPEGIKFGGYLDCGPDTESYPCSTCGRCDHVVFAMQYAESGAGAIYGVHKCDNGYVARCYAD